MVFIVHGPNTGWTHHIFALLKETALQSRHDNEVKDINAVELYILVLPNYFPINH